MAYTKEVYDKILKRIACGESVNSATKEDGMPSKTTIFARLANDEEFKNAYLLAKRACADVYADEVVSIADDIEGQPIIYDGQPVMDANGNMLRVVDNASVQHAKLRVDSRKWAAAKLQPRKYGDRLGIEHEGNVSFTVISGIESPPGSENN